ncbi:unnamed protein product [Ambrosiozyma monospora]|uniref:Unnamed protein product n=1 Tax=Ambrosiozyma monospora TaxID=43982 RepID=A0ACB5UAE8_AMBMO|nr:unnamed protein product [Ambrosiozyma monospora]
MSFALRASRVSLVRNPSKVVLNNSLRYSHGHHGPYSDKEPTHHHEEHHNEHGHGEEAHGEEGHGHHEPPLSEAENIFNTTTLGVAGVIATAVGFGAYNESYKKSHDGNSVLSIITAPKLLADVEANYQAYRDNVKKDNERINMITYRELRTPSNVITTVRGVPGRVFEQGGNAQFDTIRDFNSLEPRKIPENPFKL